MTAASRKEGPVYLIPREGIAGATGGYFGVLSSHDPAEHQKLLAILKEQHLTEYENWTQVAIILIFSLVGIGGSYAVAWFGMRVNTFANSRTAMAALSGKARPVYAIPLK